MLFRSAAPADGAKALSALSIASVLAFVASFSIGMGPIAWVYSSEIFPLHVRALGCSLGVALNRLTSGVISMTFLSLSKAISIGGAFFLFAGIASFAWVFFFTYLPETRGRTLEDMSTLFGSTATHRGTPEANNDLPETRGRMLEDMSRLSGSPTTHRHTAEADNTSMDAPN